MSDDIFYELETKTREALEGVVYELTRDMDLKFRNRFLLSLPRPRVSLCWHEDDLQALVSFQDTDDGFGDNLVRHVIDFDLRDMMASNDLSCAVWNSDGNGLTAEETRACAAFLRDVATRLDLEADRL